MSQNRKNKDDKVKKNNKDIKANLLTKFNHEEGKVNSIGHDYFDDFKFNGALSNWLNFAVLFY